MAFNYSKTRLMGIKLVWLPLLLTTLAASLSAQPDDDWFSKNDRGNRYEGSYSRKVSNPSVNLVSLTAVSPKYEWGKGQQLDVKFYNPLKQEYELHAEELTVTQFYWMQDKKKETAAGWQRFEGWQVDFLLKRLSIDARNLGVLVRLGERGSRKYAPAQVNLAGETAEAKQYVAQLRLGRPTADGSFKVYRGEKKTKENLVLEQKITAKSSGSTFPIVLAFATIGKEAGWFSVEVNLREKGTLDPFTYSFSFYHQP
jgi:hypothetical protein